MAALFLLLLAVTGGVLIAELVLENPTAATVGEGGCAAGGCGARPSKGIDLDVEGTSKLVDGRDGHLGSVHAH
jgi:hypothetical protein